MDYNETYQKYFNSDGLKNVFLQLLEISDTQTGRWIAKAKHEFTRYANYLWHINRYDKESADDYT